MPALDAKANELEAAIAGLEAQRSTLGDAVVGPAIAALRKQLAELTGAQVPQASEERKNVTILFVDVSGFTALAEKLDPEEVRNIINACFDYLVPVVQKYGGTIDKFIGDEIMALFGAPVAHENDPERALRSALEMMTAIAAFNEEHGIDLRLHIGVNTGPVVTGAIGSQQRKDYSVMGDAVNLAARLEDASADGEIYVGPTTYRLTEPLFDFHLLPPLTLKGKSEQIQVHRLLGVKTVPKPVRGIQGLRSTLIGRERELKQMTAALERLSAGIGGVVAVVGEAGVGKSRFISEALSAAAGDLDMAEGRAYSHTTGMSHWMSRDLLRALLQVSADAPPGDLERSLEQSVTRFAAAEFADIYPYLATLLHLDLPIAMQERVKFLSAEALHDRILQAFRNYVAARGRQKPLVLFWEDLHWCDPSSFSVVETILPLVNQVPVLLVLAYRPEEEFTQRFQREAQASVSDRFHLIELASLTREQSVSLVEALLRVENLPGQIRDVILDRAEGNPFFIEELLRSLLDSGAVELTGNRIVATTGIQTVKVPETVEGVLTARMDRLETADKNALQNAAVIGRMFQQTVLERLIPSGSETSLTTSLGELQRRDFIHPAAMTELTIDDYMFKHAITQDVAYHTLLKGRRKQIHQRVGEALESLFPDSLPQLSAALAYHFQRAGAGEKAFLYSKQAGERAQAIFANTEAEAFYQSAIEQANFVLPDHRTPEHVALLAQVRESLGDVLQLNGRPDEARESYTESLKLIPAADRVTRSRLQRKIGSAYTIQRRYDAMTASFDAADRELGEVPVEPIADWWSEKMQILMERMHLLYWQGKVDEMMDLARSYRSAIEERGTPIQRGQFFQRLGLLHLTRDRYLASDECVRLMEMAVSTSDDSDALGPRSHFRFTAGLAHLYHGTLPAAIEHLNGALEMGERVGDRILQARCYTYLATALRRSRDMEGTERYAERTRTLAGQLGMVEYVAMADANLAWLRWREGRMEEAESLGKQALNAWHKMEDPYGVDWLAILPIVAVTLAEGRLEQSVKYLRGLFGENQHPLPESLASVASDVLATADSLGPRAAESKFQQLVRVSEQIGYL